MLTYSDAGSVGKAWKHKVTWPMADDCLTSEPSD